MDIQIDPTVVESLEVIIPGHQRQVLVTFRRYNDAHSYVFAGQIEANLEIIQKAWKLDNARIGDFIILMANGDVKLMDELRFGEMYERPAVK